MTATPREARTPSTVAVPAETREQQYDHRISRKWPHIIQVAPVRAPGQHRREWTTYMVCETPADAQRILELLYNRVTVVTP